MEFARVELPLDRRCACGGWGRVKLAAALSCKQGCGNACRALEATTGRTILNACKFHAEGKCRKGSRCTFAHCKEDIGKDWEGPLGQQRCKAFACNDFQRLGPLALAMMQQPMH